MLRWLIRLTIGAAIIALIVWLWSRFNEDLDEEEFEEEIPVEFDVSEEEQPAPDGQEAAAGLQSAAAAVAAPDLDVTRGESAPTASEPAVQPSTGEAPAIVATEQETNPDAGIEPRDEADRLAARSLLKWGSRHSAH